MYRVHRDGATSATQPTDTERFTSYMTEQSANPHIPTEFELDAKATYDRISVELERHRKAMHGCAQRKRELIIKLRGMNYTQDQIAEMIGISKARVQQLERGKRKKQ